MARGIVCVLPGMLPATMMVAPNSPRARENDKTMPDSKPCQAIGKLTVQNTRHSFAPSVRAASSSLASML